MKSYLIDPVQLISTNQGLIRAERLQTDFLIKSPQGINKILEINKVEKLVKQISFKNGWITFLDFKNHLQVLDNLVPVSQIKTDDFVNFCFFNYFNLEKETPINWIDRQMSIPIRIPKKLSLDFAYWLGIVSAQSKSSVNHRHIQIEIKKEGPLKEIFTSLTKKIFNLTVDIVKEGDRTFMQINSSNLVKFLQHSIGRRLMIFRKVPVFIQESDIMMQMAYVRGLSLKGHRDGSKYIIYSGSSKSIAEFVASFLTSIGYGVYRKIKKLDTKKIYNVLVTFCHKDTVRIDSDFVKGINTAHDVAEFNQNYFVSSATVFATIQQIKERNSQLRKELKWQIKLLKEEQKNELYNFKKNFKDKSIYQNELITLKKTQKMQLESTIKQYKDTILANNPSKILGYKTIMKAKQRKQVFISAQSVNLDEIMSEASYLVKVKDVKILKKEMIEIVTSADSGIIIDGLIVQ